MVTEKLEGNEDKEKELIVEVFVIVVAFVIIEEDWKDEKLEKIEEMKIEEMKMKEMKMKVEGMRVESWRGKLVATFVVLVLFVFVINLLGHVHKTLKMRN